MSNIIKRGKYKYVTNPKECGLKETINTYTTELVKSAEHFSQTLRLINLLDSLKIYLDGQQIQDIEYLQELLVKEEERQLLLYKE